MAAADSTTYLGALKRSWTQADITRAIYDSNVAFALMPKREDLDGEANQIAIRFGNTSGRSAKFPNAKANKTASPIDKWLVTSVEDYSLFSVTGKIIRQSANKKGAIVDALKEELDSAMDAMNRSFGIGIFGDGGGCIGIISSGSNVATATITLSDINQIVNFEKGQVLALSSTTSGTTVTVRSGTVTVSAVDRDLGTITVSASTWATGIPAAATGDGIYVDGDAGVKMRGLAAWLPASAPTAGDSFFGMDRSQDPTRLAGVRVSGLTLPIEEAVKKYLQRSFRNGGKTSHIFMNDSNFLDLDLSLGSRRVYADTKAGDVGFTGIKFYSPGSTQKPVEIYPDFNCPFNTAYGVTMEDWSVRGVGAFPFIDSRDGVDKILREDAADAFEGRIVSYHNAVCVNPSRSGRLTLG